MTSSKRPTQTELHPISEHRTPREIAADEAGSIGQPDLDVVAEEVSSASAQRFPAARQVKPAGGRKRPGKRR
jgi:flagellar basal body rod protein FlgC